MSSNGQTGRSETADRALDILEELAQLKGLDDVSMRDVAKHLGISLAALQYHYPSKAALIDCFVDRTIESYRLRIESLARSSEGQHNLEALVGFCAKETLEIAGGGLLAAIEARANHDETSKLAMDRFANAYLEVLIRGVATAHSNLSDDKVLLAATLICATLDGLPAAIAAASARSADTASLLQDVIKFATHIPTYITDRDEPLVSSAPKP